MIFRTHSFFAKIAALTVLCTPTKADAWSPAMINVSCPEGTRAISKGGYPFFRPTIDLFAGLYHDIQPITICHKSGFPSYRKFTRDELKRVAKLMETSAYKDMAASETTAKIALWFEEKINEVVEPRLSYRLRLHDAYFGVEGDDTDPEIQRQRFGRVLSLVRDEYEIHASDSIERARLQLQIAYLSHRLGKSDSPGWLERAADGFKALPTPMDHQEKGVSSPELDRRSRERFRYDALQRNVDGVRLCVSAPDDLTDALCEAQLSAQDSRGGYHGIEALAHWALQPGPMDPDSRDEETRTREQFEYWENQDGEWARKFADELRQQLDSGPEYFRNRALKRREKMRSTLREREENSLFKKRFDQSFISAIKSQTHRYAEGSHYHCDLLNLIYDREQKCGIDGSPGWKAAHERFPEIMATLREERRQQILRMAIHIFFGGNEDHRAVIWAKGQTDFDDALERVRPAYLRSAASSAGRNSAQCDLGGACDETTDFDAAIHHSRPEDDIQALRQAYDQSRASVIESEVRSLAWCDVRVELEMDHRGRCLTGQTRDARFALLEALSDRFGETYARSRASMLKSEAERFGRSLGNNEVGRRGFQAAEYSREKLEALHPNADEIIEKSRKQVLKYWKEREAVQVK